MGASATSGGDLGKVLALDWKCYLMQTTRYLWFLLSLFVAGISLLDSIGLAADRPHLLLVLADNWRWPNAGALGDPHAHTPAFDRIAREGVVFTHTFNPVPSCSPTRACLLTGMAAHQLGERASLWSAFPKDQPVVTQLLRDSGYHLGYAGKAWAPGNHEISGWSENPVGPKYSSFTEFLDQRDQSKPFFFWLGNTDTATRAGKLPFADLARQENIDPSSLTIPPELPDCPELRDDLLNYYGGIISLDRAVAVAIKALEDNRLLENTVIIYMSDNGWQMPRGLANCYDAGSRVPLAIRWGNRLQPGRKVDAFVNVADLGPTLLELAGLTPPKHMTMRSIKNLLLGQPDSSTRDAVFIERERHANVRRDSLSYPVRAVRTAEHLYIRNLRPERWPAGDPDVLFLHERPFGDVDTTGVKDVLLKRQSDPVYATYAQLIFNKRPAEELYDLHSDPDQIHNVADSPNYSAVLQQLRSRVDQWMLDTNDPRVDPNYDGWDKFPYYGKAPKK